MQGITLIKFFLMVTVGLGMSGGLLAWRERPEPGALPLVFLLAGQCWWSATLIFRIDATTFAAKVLWVNLSWIGVAVIPVAWLFFALDYVGYDEYTMPRCIAIASIIPAVTVALALTDGAHNLLYTSATLVERNGVMTLTRTPGPWFWVIAGYTYFLGLLGAFPLFKLVTSEVSSFRGQSLTLLVGIMAPWLTNIVYLFDYLPTAGVDPTPIAFSISGVAYLGALTQFKLLGTTPTPIRKGRRSLFQQMHQGALILDAHDIIVDMNDHATSALGVSRASGLGKPLESISPELHAIDDTSETRKPVFSPETSNRSFDVTENVVTDIHDREIGRVITLHEVSGFLRMQQRLEVLHRAFRHNIRTHLQVIIGIAEYLGDEDKEEQSQLIIENAEEIEYTGDKIRAIMDLFEQSRQPRERMHLNSILNSSVEKYSQVYPEVTFEFEGKGDGIHVDSNFDVVCSNLVENAAEHNTAPDPHVTITIEHRQEDVEVRIADNGPGIDENELTLLEIGSETPLEHGSGFGLALAIWGTDISGGEITFEENNLHGTTVRLNMPTLDEEFALED